MILSQVVLPDAVVRDPYQWHRSLWSLFPDRPDAQREFLYRVEAAKPGQAGRVLLLSTWEPQGSASIPILATRPFAPELQAGQRLRFCLVANPVRCIRDDNGRIGKDGKAKACRVPIVQEAAQLDWVIRKLNGAATVDSAIVSTLPALHFRKRGQTPGKLVPARYDGILSVRSPAALLSILAVGIGPAKSFGCGLLTLARA